MKKGTDLGVIAGKVVDQAIERGSRDNITITIGAIRDGVDYNLQVEAVERGEDSRITAPFPFKFEV